MKFCSLVSRTLRFSIFSTLITGSILVFLSGGTLAKEKPLFLSVAVSIKPLHSLISGLMEGTGRQPFLIVSGRASPHSYSLKPSVADRISHADLIFWIGPSMEKFLEKPLQSLAEKARIVSFIPEQGFTETPPDQGNGHEHHGHDPHIWLSPIEATTIIKIAAKKLTEADPGNADLYSHNAKLMTKRLNILQAEIKILLAPVRSRPFFVFHDAYSHLAEAFGLKIVGVVTTSPDRAPGARRIAELRKLMQAGGVSCLFGEPHMDSGRLNMIVENIESARIGVLDPLGADIPAGKDMYFTLMRANARALADCLSVHTAD